MTNGYSRSPKLLKGALIQFSAPMLIPIPNIIVFQYNPETRTRTLTPWTPLERVYTYSDTGEQLRRAGLIRQSAAELDCRTMSVPSFRIRPLARVRYITDATTRTFQRTFCPAFPAPSAVTANRL